MIGRDPLPRPTRRTPGPPRGARIRLEPIDDRARDGRPHLVRGPEHYAVARWNDGRWVFPRSGTPLDFEPIDYRP
jgi:hypothetical protein